MTSGFILIIAFLIIATLIAWYLYHIYFNAQSFLNVHYTRLETTLTRMLRLEHAPQSAIDYFKSLLLTNGLASILCYVLLRIQHVLWLNPNHVQNMSPDLAFHTVISFVTNTNLQHYAGETSLSYFSQMAVITFLMFLSAGSGFCIALAFIRRMTGNRDVIGNYYSDLIKWIVLVLLPLSCLVNLLLMHEGVIQTLQKTFNLQR